MYCYLEFKFNYLLKPEIVSIGVKNLFETGYVFLGKKGDGLLKTPSANKIMSRKSDTIFFIDHIMTLINHLQIFLIFIIFFV